GSAKLESCPRKAPKELSDIITFLNELMGRGPESDGRAKSLGPTNRVVGTERRLWASCRALGSNLSDRSKWGPLAGSRDMFRYRRQMRKFFDVFGDMFLFNSRFDAGKHFYDNAVIRPCDVHLPEEELVKTTGP